MKVEADGKELTYKEAVEAAKERERKGVVFQSAVKALFSCHD